MVKGRHILACMVAALIATATGYAGMAPLSSYEAEGPGIAFGSVRPVYEESPLVGTLESLSGRMSLPLDSLPLAEAEPDGEAPTPQITTDRQNSLELCLYALLSFGICRSAPWVKRFSLGVIPDWYHDGGPSQIGHSLAAPPNCLCSTLVYFVQPEPPADDRSAVRRHRVVTARWRESQFTPAILAPRAPPLL